jgi:NADPH:quinone reductase-like Zn-dependent oxidoreductase
MICTPLHFAHKILSELQKTCSSAILVKAAIFEEIGLDHLQVRDIPRPSVESHDVLIRVKMAGVNPVDSFVVSGMRQVKPMPHIPGSEFAGIVEEFGNHVTRVREGDRVAVYNRLFDEACDMCISGKEMLCRTGGIRGVVTNGGFSELVSVPEKNVFKVPESIGWELAASLPVSALTAYHALNEAQLRVNECLTVFGASGNTGMFATQFGKKFGAKVIAVTSKDWLKDYGADHTVKYEDSGKEIERLTGGKMADVVINSLGLETWVRAFDVLGAGGRLVFFGTLTGGKVDLNLDRIYGRQQKIIGTTGGSRKEMQELVDNADDLKVRVWRKFRLEEAQNAIRSLRSKERDGRILLQL